VHDPLRRPWTEPGRDPELAHAAQRGDLAELFTLLREYRRELWRVCFALTLDRHRAERLLHDTLLRAAKNLRSVPNGAAFLPWLVRLAAHLASGSARRADGARRDAPPTLTPEALGTALTEQEARALGAFAQLPESDRFLLALAAVERLPYVELAAVSKREVTTLMQQLAMLRVRIAEEDAA
jgi:DNA-directed RNA polymerase specialized sigma24 family protein